MQSNDMHDIAPILRSLGFLESEVKVYLAAVELGPSTVIDLAGATRLSRPATYTAVEALRERGIMGTLVAGKRRLFAAEHPDRLLAYAKRKETSGLPATNGRKALGFQPVTGSTGCHRTAGPRYR